MKCLGRTKNLKRCKNNCKFILCWRHRFQWFALISIPFFAYLNLSTGLLNTKELNDWFFSDSDKISETYKSFVPVFQKDSSSFNILITRFEDFANLQKENCIGQSVREHLYVLEANKKLPLKLNVIYVDSISNPVSASFAKQKQSLHNADLIIYGKAANIEDNCGDADVCFRHNIDQSLFPKETSELDLKITDHGIDYTRISPLEIEQGRVQIDSISMEKWITSLINVKANKAESDLEDLEIFLDDYKNIPKEEKAKKLNSRGSISFNSGLYKLSIKSYLESIKNFPSSNTYRLLGNSYRAIYDYEKALDNYKKALLINLDNYKTLMDMGTLFYYKKEYLNSIDYYTRALEKNSKNKNSLRNIGLCYYEMEEYDKALIYFNKGLQAFSNPEVLYYNIGNVYKKQQKYDKAITNYKKAISINPSFSFSYSSLGYIYLVEEQYDLAITNLTKFISISPNDDIDYSNRATAYFSKKNYTKTIEDCKKAIKLNPENAYYYSLLGGVYEKQKRYKLALENFNFAIERDSASSLYYRRKAIALINLNNDYEALKALNHSIALDSTNPISYKYKGVLFKNKKKYDDALFYYTKAIKINPKYDKALNHRGVLYFNLGRYDQAITDVREAKRLNSSKFIYSFNLIVFYAFKYWFVSISLILFLTYLIIKFRKKIFSLKLFYRFHNIL